MATRRGRRKKVCARGSNPAALLASDKLRSTKVRPALLGGPSTHPLGDVVALSTVIFSAALAASNPSPGQLSLLQGFRVCLDEVAAHTKSPSPCAMRDPTSLIGVSRTDLLNTLGQPTFCIPKPGAYLPWRFAECRGAQVDIGYSFYRLPENWVGGGPELMFFFDSNGAVQVARWMYSQ